MSTLENFYSDGSPIPPQPETEEKKSIFNSPMQNRVDQRGTATIKASEVAQKLHAIKHQQDDGAPDFRGMMLQCTTGFEKMKVKEAQAAWQDEQKWKAHLEAQAATDARIQQVKQTPNRNKAYYEKLQREDGRVYWSTEVQKQMRNDRSAQGLNWHSKK